VSAQRERTARHAVRDIGAGLLWKQRHRFSERARLAPRAEPATNVALRKLAPRLAE